MSCGIYKITNLINNKVYIGQSVNIERRWGQEKSRRVNTYLKHAFNFYGIDNFKFEIIKQQNIGEKFTIGRIGVMYKMRDFIFYLCITLFFITSFITLLAIKNEEQKIAELENSVIYFKTQAETLRAEQDKQARLIETDLIIYANGFEMGK